MDDVASVRLENANLKRIQSKLLQWEIKEHPLAPLTNQQEDALDQLNQLLGEQCAQGPPTEKDPDKSYSNQLSNEFPSKLKFELSSLKSGIDTSSDFLAWFDQVEDKIHDRSNCSYRKYLCELESRSLECNTILQEIHFCLQKLEDLKKECAFVSNNTSSLNSSSEKLILEQNQLSKIDAEISKRLHYFTQAEHLTQRLQNPTLSVSSDNFRECLNKVDDCLDYLRKNVNFKDASAYIVRYKHCLSKAITLMRCYVTQILVQASYQVNFPNKSNEDEKSNSEMTFALFYGKFHTTAIKVKKISSLIEERIERSPEYEMLLVELHQCYLTERAKVMSPAVEKAIKELKVNNKGDHCALVRGSCAFLVHICQDEYRLFYQFFTKFSDQLNSYLEGLCVILYDNLRPFIIHINHLETLAEICGILRTELLDEQVQQNPETLEAFGKVAFQLLQDVQERLVFRAHLYLQSDILNYNPSAGDLAYPDKLEMMESIALSLQEPTLRRSDSRVSVSSSISSVATDSELVDSIRGRFLSNSPADLHGMWYPTVRRTLVCLSRLYRCVDRPIFQGLSQEALKYCIQSVSNAASKISTSKTVIDGELFEIKHLLILREQIAPFRVDFTVKETSLDFSKIKTAAFGLLQKRRQLFSLGSNNALLEFLLEGTPQVKEHLLDSRKDVDRQLKTVCEQFIKDAVQMLIGPLLIFLEKANSLVSEINVPDKPASKINYALRQSPWASPQQISVYIQESQRLLKSKLSGLQRSMQLYLSNRDTEFIIFRPIRNNIISAFVKLEQILTTNAYTQDDMTIANCPSAEQVSLLLSSVSILADSTLAPGPITTKGSSSQQTQVTRKLSEEKKVSFDDSV